MSRPAPGRWPQWDHPRGSASRRDDSAVEGLRTGLACSRADLAVLHDDLFSMSWHTARLPLLASPLASGFVLACLARWVTAPSEGWQLPVALGPSSPTTFSPCGRSRPSPDALCVFRREREVLSEATPSKRRRALQARNVLGSPPPSPRPRGRTPLVCSAAYGAASTHMAWALVATCRMPWVNPRGMTPHHPSASPSLSPAPSGPTPVSRKRQSAMSHFRATATIPIRRTRLPPLPKRSRNQPRKALSG